MNKILIVNWNRIEEGLGGQEFFFSVLSKVLNARRISYTDAEKVFGYNFFSNALNILYRGYIIDSYLEWHEKLFFPDLIIRNSAIGGFKKFKTPQIIVFQDPYLSITLKMLEEGIFLTKPEHYLACIELMRRTAKYGKCVAVSNFMKKDMKLCGIKCDKVIEEGIDTEKFKPVEDKEEIKRSHNLPLDKKIAVCVTKFTPTKGWHILSDLIKNFQDIHWIVVLTNKIESKPKLKNVTLIEEANPEIMPRIYNCADFYISTSPVESFGLSAIESASCDLPIIIYKTGFAWDWWDKRLGLRVDEWTSEAFGHAIKNLFIEDRVYEPRKAIIERGFTSERMAKDWKGFIENLLKK